MLREKKNHQTFDIAKMRYFTSFFSEKQSENICENNFFCVNAKF